MLAKKTNDLVESAENNSEHQLRAYLFVEEMSITGVAVGLVPSVELTLKNSGQTPAKNLTVWIRMGISTFPKSSEPPDVDNSNASVNPLGPNGKMETGTTFNAPLTANQMDLIQKCTHALYCVGEIKYDDVFGINRTTKFKFFKNGMNLNSQGMKVCIDGNDYI